MKTTKVLIATLIFLFLIAGCNKEKQNVNLDSQPKDKQTTQTFNSSPPDLDEKNLKKDAPSSKTEGTISQTNNQTEQNIDVSKRLIVKTGTMNLEIDNYDVSEKKVFEIAKNLNGFIVSSNAVANSAGKKSGSIIIKVPVDKYDNLIEDISTVGKVASKNISSSDVTEQYIDFETRVKTQKELEQRLLKLLAEKTARLTDVVEVEYKLASVRQNIESIEGKMKFLMNQATYSSLTVSLYEPSLLETTSGGGFFYELGEAVKTGLRGFTNILSGLITFIIAILPVVILILLVLWIIFKIIKRKSKFKVQTAEK